MEKNRIEYMLSKAESIKKGGFVIKSSGICLNIVKYHKNTALDIAFIANILTGWNKFSGNSRFSIPHPILSPEKAYSASEDKWDKRTIYGHNRWEALDFLIGETK